MQRALVALLALLAVMHGEAGAAHLGAGVYGGVRVPIVQDDNGTGGLFGVRVPVNVLPLVTFEPYFASAMLGGTDHTFGGIAYTRSGFDVTAYGLNVALGGVGLLTGFPLYPYAGIGSHKLSRDGSDDATEVGYNFGLGLAFPVPSNLSIQLRGQFNLIATGDTSRKFVDGTLGVTYKFLSR